MSYLMSDTSVLLMEICFRLINKWNNYFDKMWSLVWKAPILGCGMCWLGFLLAVLCWLGDERVFKGGTVELPSMSIFNDKVLF